MEEIVILNLSELYNHQSIKEVVSLDERVGKGSLGKILNVVETKTIIEGYTFVYPISTPTDILFCFKKDVE